jgi:hypothetical protein
VAAIISLPFLCLAAFAVTKVSQQAGSTSAAAVVAASTPAAAGSPSVPVPQQLRDLDAAAGVNVGTPAAYDAAFKTLSSRCQEQGVSLGNEVGAILGLLQKSNVTDETQLSVMQHVAQSIPPGQKMGCADIGAAYVTLRTNGQ